jgi:Na+-transporting NADH:ubiquinone oxidoreductase subunit C
MKKESFARKRIYPVIFMLLVTVAFVTVTTVIYTLTGERIKLNERLRLKQAVLLSAGMPLPAEPGAVDRAFDDRVDVITDSQGQARYYEVRDAGSAEILSYVVIYTGAGLWGEITAGIGFDADIVKCTGIEIIDQNETPGLGGRIDEAWFKEQFRGKSFPLSTVPEGDPASEREIQAITGATYSSQAMKAIVNDAREFALAEIKGSE